LQFLSFVITPSLVAPVRTSRPWKTLVFSRARRGETHPAHPSPPLTLRGGTVASKQSSRDAIVTDDAALHIVRDNV